MTNSENLKPYALAKVYIDGDNFIHESIQTFFTFDGALKEFNLAAGIEWEAVDTIDDYL